MKMKNKSPTCQPHLAQYTILRSLPSIGAYLLFCRGRYGFGDVLYSSRECSTNQTFFAKQTQSQVLRIWLSSLMTSIYGTGTFGEMRKQTQYKAKQTQFL
jgi:hypothetical protein